MLLLTARLLWCILKLHFCMHLSQNSPLLRTIKPHHLTTLFTLYPPNINDVTPRSYESMLIPAAQCSINAMSAFFSPAPK